MTQQPHEVAGKSSQQLIGARLIRSRIGLME